MAPHELLPALREQGEGSALSELLKRAVVHEEAGGPVPRELLVYAIVGAGCVLAAGLLALVLPSPDAIRGSRFFLVLSGPAASLEALMHALAVPAVLLGTCFLGIDLWLTHGARKERWRAVIVGQAAAGGAGGVLATLFLALVILNLAIWIALRACVLMAVGAVLGALGG